MNRTWKRIRNMDTGTSACTSTIGVVSLGIAALALPNENPAASAAGVTGGSPTILYVDDDAPAAGDGLTWATAVNDLETALEATIEAGSEIRVAQGTYRPTLRTDPDDPRSATFQLISGVTLRGGYAGLRVPDPDEWNPGTFITTLSGDLNSNDGPDFANYGENAYHVVVGDGVGTTTVLQGVVVTGGNANIENAISMSHRGGGMRNVAGSPLVQDCVFIGNTAHEGGAMYNQYGGPVIASSRFEANVALNPGGALRNHTDTTVKVIDCDFVSNVGGFVDGGGAISCKNVTSLHVIGSRFTENATSGSGGAVVLFVFGHANPVSSFVDCAFRSNRAGSGGAISAHGASTLQSCRFENNIASLGGGAITIGGLEGSGTLTSCIFDGNQCDLFGGAILCAAPGAPWTLRLINCRLTNNHANRGGGMFIAADAILHNCTIAANSGTGLMLIDSEFSGSLEATNCILWANIPEQVGVDHGGPPGGESLVGSMIISHSTVQDGWLGAGSNNIDADPLFIQPGCGNFRLGDESPCLNAGSNAAIPPGVTTDIDGQPRIQDGIVDLGAYEGAFDMLDPAACDEDVDVEETAMLAPLGYGYNPVAHSLVQFSNMIGPDNAFASLTHFDADLHPSAGGFSELGPILRLETSIADGQHYSRMFLSFDAAMLNGLDPLSVDLTRFDANSNDWTLAAAGNTVNSPGHDDPVGDRIVMVGTGTNYGLTFDMGDHGVFWNPDLQRGFVWANVDAAGEFAVGALSCPADCAVPTDGQVNVQDLLTVIAQWGSAVPGTTADINGDGAVDVDDLVAVILAWGVCPS